MKPLALWRNPGAVVTLVLVVAALLFLLAHRGAYQGSNGYWVWEMVAHGLLLTLVVVTVLDVELDIAFVGLKMSDAIGEGVDVLRRVGEIGVLQ